MGRFAGRLLCLLMPLIKCLKGHKSLGSLCSVVSVVKTLIVSGVRQTEGLGCSGELKTKENFVKQQSYHLNLLWLVGFRWNQLDGRKLGEPPIP